MKKLAIITTHPIQYNAPWFRLLAEQQKMVIKVFYTWSQSEKVTKYDPGFGKNIHWDIPLLEGYDYVFVENVAKDPGTHHFRGIINPTLIKTIEEWKPDRILVLGWNFESHLKCLRYFHRKIPVFFRGDSTLLRGKHGFSIKKMARRLFLRWIYHYVDIAFFVGESNKQYYLAHGLKERQLAFTPHAIDNARFGQNETKYREEAGIWRRQLGIQDNHVVILFAGKLEPIKNPGILLDAVLNIQDENILLLYVGNGILEKDLKARAKNDKRILFLEFQNQLQMPIVYHMCNFLVLPSRSETWGLAINEAMVCGKPAIVSDTCGCAANLVTNGVTGYVFPQGNLEVLKERILQLLPVEETMRMGAAARERIKDYSFMNIVKEIQRH